MAKAEMNVHITMHYSDAYWRLRRHIDYPEALACWVLAQLTDGWVAGLWTVLGFLCVFHVWTWLERRHTAPNNGRSTAP